MTITKGTPPRLPWPTNLKAGGSENSDCGVPCVKSRLRPRVITMKASETMKKCSPMRVTQSPIRKPMKPQAAMAIRLAVHGSSPARNSVPPITIDRHTTEPTERSMPPTISRIVMPMTTMPSIEKESRIARILPQVRK